MALKLYFVGEFGYVFRQLLPFLETCPTQIDLITWDSTCKIVELLWPSRYILTPAETILDPSVFHLRDCTHLRDANSTKLLENMGYKHVFSIDHNHKVFHDDTHMVYGVLHKKLMYGEQKESKPYVSIFPRSRHIQVGKNNISQEHIDWIKTNYPDKEIIGHGFSNERINFNIRYCQDIYEQINVLNNSVFLICPSSGLADLSLICGCNVILTGEYPALDKTNPHNCSIKQWKDVK